QFIQVQLDCISISYSPRSFGFSRYSADVQDAALQNPWGNGVGPTLFWIGNNGSGTSTLVQRQMPCFVTPQRQRDVNVPPGRAASRRERDRQGRFLAVTVDLVL